MHKESCITCGEKLTKVTQITYCSRACAASANNKKRLSKKESCIVCGLSLRGQGGDTFCSKKCEGWHRTTEAFNTGTATPRTVRNYILGTRDHVCSCCGLHTWNEQPIPLDVDHIDGNPYNNHIENLRLLCKNCHAQTETYGSKNNGRGRTHRYR